MPTTAVRSAHVGQDLKIVFGQHTTVAADDLVAIPELKKVLGVVAQLEDAPHAGASIALGFVGDQAGTPAAGSIRIRTYKATATADTAPIAATTFSRKVNYVAFGI